MKRKVIKQGNGTLTITLPKQWTNKVGLKGGDEIDINEGKMGLLLNTQYHEVPKSISINIDDLEQLALAKLLIACFEQGYDTISLNFTKPKMKSWTHGTENTTNIINFFVGRLVGFEVTSQTSKSITIRNLSKKFTRFEDILPRLFFLIKEYLQHLTDAMKTGDYSDLKECENRHDNITKLVALASRMVCEENKYSKIETLNYFTILNYMDKITDFIRYAYRNTDSFKKKVSKETIVLAEKALEYIELYRHFFYKFDYKQVNELDKLRAEIKRLFIESSKKNKESSITSNFESIVETMHGIIKSRISFELNKDNLIQTAV